MNNRTIIFLFVFVVLLMTGCKERHSQVIDVAYQLSATAPDSALSVLDGVNQAKLSKASVDNVDKAQMCDAVCYPSEMGGVIVTRIYAN